MFIYLLFVKFFDVVLKIELVLEIFYSLMSFVVFKIFKNVCLMLCLLICVRFLDLVLFNYIVLMKFGLWFDVGDVDNFEFI